MRGGEKVLEEIASLLPDAPIYTLFHFPGSVSEALERHTIHTSFLQTAPGLRRHYRRYLPLYTRAIEDLDLTSADLIVSSSHCVAKGVVPAPGAFHLCYCHTPVRYAWDQEHAYFPKRTGIVAQLRGRVLSSLRRWDVASAGRVTRYLANSQFVADRIDRYYRREATVVHPPVDTEFFTPGDGQRGEYALFVSALAPYKRVDLAIAACNAHDIELRIVGDGPDRDRLRKLAGEKTRFLGRVDATTLRSLYRGARCFVQPGVEDFGISAVEAIACGCPVVARGEGGVLDIVRPGMEGVLYGPAYDLADLTSALKAIVSFDFDEDLLRERALLFSEERFSGTMGSILEEAQEVQRAQRCFATSQHEAQAPSLRCNE
jgi:glycosyltransferase involved in cell wall biosynthesis